MLKLNHHLTEGIIQSFQGKGSDLLWHPSVESLCNASGYTGDGIAVSTDGDSFPDSIFVTVRFQEGPDGLGNGARAGGIKAIVFPDFIDGLIQIITKGSLDIFLNLGLATPRPCKEYGSSYSLGTLDSFGVIVGNPGTPFRFFKHFLQVTLIACSRVL